MSNEVKATWSWSRDQIERHQLKRLNALLGQVRQRPFYRERLAGIELPLRSLTDLSAISLLTKQQLASEQEGQPSGLFDLPPASYCRFHQTSGTSGHPLPVLDTAGDWTWWIDCWDHVLTAAEVTANDVAMMAFSFGPFIGFWTANDALVRRGAMAIPGGGMSSMQRLKMIFDHRCTTLCCTPTYALHLAGVAAESNLPLGNSPIEKIVVAGEPGGSIRTVRDRIETLWGARVIDHAGASEVGAWGFGSHNGAGLHVIETEFIAELLRFDDRHPQGVAASDGEPAELVLTGLGRLGGPAIRYRTGDVVRATRDHDQPCSFLWLDGGVLGRADAMLVIRGVNVFPSSIEAIVRELLPTTEFRMIVTRSAELDQLEIEIEGETPVADRLSNLVRERLALRVPVRAVAQGTLPRFEAKARRLVDQRDQ